MKKHRKFLLLFLLFVGTVNTIHAQEDEFRKAYEDFRKQTKVEYDDFRQKCNAEYAEFLKQAWENYKVLPAIPRPKDDTVPPVTKPKGDDAPIENDEVPIDEVVTPPTPVPQPLPVAPIYEDKEMEGNVLAFTFFGTEANGRVPKEMCDKLTRLNNGLSGEALAETWEALAGGGYDNLIRDCLELRIKHQLCDWAYLMMLRSLGESYCGGRCNAATMLTAWLYCQSGYQMRLAMGAGKLYLLVGSKHLVYDLPYYTVEGATFYPVLAKGEAMEGRVQICGAAFPNEQPLSLLLPKAQLFAERLSAVRRITSEEYPAMTATVQTNQNLLDFYSTYPTSMLGDNPCSRWAMYANTPMASNVTQTLYLQLRKAIAGRGQLEAVEMLLNWVQTGFVYEYDDKVWGGDRAFFAEETLFYPYCDCEDRSILFTRLVRDLLGLRCILVYYPGHLAAAVRFTEAVNGDHILLDGHRYTIADPTYIGAPVGRTMPGMDNKGAMVIALE